ncbi:MAG: nicotinate-nucleotide--dimethylbenzimidazole phosphoribosyltransferase [Caldilineaceae bacterium]|nr:nicotinate-nucleotide--dimethylbenzimidazole phosphoribosyltransferase [Caldilineaceae bacterium]
MTQETAQLRTRLAARIDAIRPLDQAAMDAARARQQILTKPAGSLGRLEALSIQLAGILGTPAYTLRHKVITVMAGDHGVVDAGVSAFPQAVTGQMVANFVQGGAAINVLARGIDARVVVVDMGVAADTGHWPDVVQAKVAPGTANFVVGPAMTRTQALRALDNGAAVVEAECARGLDILGTGEMGIGNTTAATAIAAALTGRDPAQLAGRGTGVDDAGLARKIAAVQRGLAVNRPDPADALDVLAKVGGFEIGGLAGAMLAAAARQRPVVIDGLIAGAAAMIAVGLAPQVRDYLFAGHRSAEPGHSVMLAWLGLEPLLDLGLRLGEGTGAALAMGVLDAAARLLQEMATFADAGIAPKSEE